MWLNYGHITALRRLYGCITVQPSLKGHFICNTRTWTATTLHNRLLMHSYTAFVVALICQYGGVIVTVQVALTWLKIRVGG